MSAAVKAADGVGLPDLAGAASVAAVPLVAHGTLLGVLYLESAAVGTYGPGNERLLRVVGRQIAATLALLEADDREEPAPPPTEVALAGAALQLTRYQADDTILAAGEYVIRARRAGSCGAWCRTSSSRDGSRSPIASCAWTSAWASPPSPTISRLGCSCCASAWRPPAWASSSTRRAWAPGVARHPHADAERGGDVRADA